MKTTKVEIKNMTCHACEKVVSKRLSAIEGVRGVAVDIQKGNAIITAADSIHLEGVIKALSGTHYQVVNVE